MSWRHALRSSDQNLCIGIQSSRVRVPTCALPLYLLTTDSSPIRSIHTLFLGKRIQYGSTLYTRSKHSLWSQNFSKYQIKCTYSISTLKDVFVTFFALFVDLTEFCVCTFLLLTFRHFFLSLDLDSDYVLYNVCSSASLRFPFAYLFQSFFASFLH